MLIHLQPPHFAETGQSLCFFSLAPSPCFGPPELRPLTPSRASEPRLPPDCWYALGPRLPSACWYALELRLPSPCWYVLWVRLPSPCWYALGPCPPLVSSFILRKFPCSLFPCCPFAESDFPDRAPLGASLYSLAIAPLPIPLISLIRQTASSVLLSHVQTYVHYTKSLRFFKHYPL